jgi:hypothetical protein
MMRIRDFFLAINSRGIDGYLGARWFGDICMSQEVSKECVQYKQPAFEVQFKRSHSQT